MFDDWKKHCQQFNLTTDASDLVFRHPDNTNQGEAKIGQVIGTTNVAFKRVLKRFKLSMDANGNQRTVYSIRHRAISNALRRNVSLNAVSKNAGVSVETLSRAYDHTESADYILEMTKHDYTGLDQMEAQT